ncbi:hypothetical protein GQF42_00105 [Streptomyces broussonetiae]|uniref:Uncharacterized protein n=1 Tax=Streptomyces broussonetiae TaxID=2686304 RepID=A0A6I6MR93_9ACTN|nr:hypothetical protein [Streptomyces broussonetiae]QHA01992.1 hypothetical protein GQF42_00105 [Streptomyces broussonetiae]
MIGRSVGELDLTPEAIGAAEPVRVDRRLPEQTCAVVELADCFDGAT